MQVAVEAVGHAVEGEVGCLVGTAVAEEVGAGRAAAGVSGADAACSAACTEFVVAEVFAVAYAVVVQFVDKFAVIGACECHFHARHGSLCHAVGIEHVREAALVHGDAGAFVPSALPEVLGKVAQEGSPEFLIFLAARGGAELAVGAGGLVEIAELHVPGHHGEAVYLTVDAAGVEQHNPAVEDVVVVGPSAVAAAHGLHHGVEFVVALVAPRLVEEDGRGYLLP